MAWFDDGEIQAGGCTYIASSTDPSRSSTSPSRRVVQPEAEWVSILPLVGKPFLLRTLVDRSSKKKKGGRCTCVLFASTWYSTTVQATFTCTVHGSRRIDPPASLLASEASLHVQLVASIVVIVAGSTRS